MRRQKHGPRRRVPASLIDDGPYNREKRPLLRFPWLPVRLADVGMVAERVPWLYVEGFDAGLCQSGGKAFTAADELRSLDVPVVV